MKLFRPHSFLFALVLLGALAALWWGLGYSSKNPFSTETPSQDVNERGEDVAPGPGEAVAPAMDLRAGVIAKVEMDATRVLLQSQDKNSIQRFWFSSDREVYVEYKRKGQSSTDRMAFIVVTGDPQSLKLKREALYGSGEAGGWELLEGTEVLYTKSQGELYQKDSLGNWVKNK